MAISYPLTGLLSFLLAAGFFAAAWGYGRTILRDPRLPPLPIELVRIALGAGVLGYAAFFLGILGLLHRPILLVLIGAGMVLLVSFLGVPRVPPAAEWVRSRVSRLSTTGRASGAVAVLALLFALLGAMLPEIEYDALWYHLTFPARYLRSGRLLDLACEHMSPTPQQAEMLYTYGLLLGDARGAKSIHWGFGVLTALWTAWLAARWVGMRWAALAAALVLTAPTVLWEMTTAYNELPLAFFATGSVALLLEWRTSGKRRVLLLAAALLGLGLAGKHLGFLFLAPLTLGVLLVPVQTVRRHLRRRTFDGSLYATVAILVAVPWYIRAWYYTGNPLFPMFYDVFAAVDIPVDRWDAQAQAGWSAAMERYGHGREPLDLLLLPWRATWDGVSYAGSLGPAWLLLLPIVPLFWGRLRRETRLLALLAAVYIVLWASPFSSFQLRYMVPAIPVLAVVAVGGLCALTTALAATGWFRTRRVVLGGVVAVLFLNLPPFQPLADARTGWVPHTFHEIHSRAWRTAAGLDPPHAYTRSRLESYDAARWIDRRLPPEARVVWFGEAAHYYVRQELVMDYSRCVVDGTWAPPGAENEAYAALRNAGVTHIAWDRTRTDLDPSNHAIRSEPFLREFGARVYRDEVIEIHELRPPSDEH